MNAKAAKGLVAVLLALIVLGCIWFFLQDTSTPPAMSVSIRGAELEGNQITLEWVVGNDSEQTITFDDHQIVQITLNGKEIPYPVEATSLEPQEEAVFFLSLPGAKTDQINHLEISAACNEGTTGTFQETIYPPVQQEPTSPAP